MFLLVLLASHVFAEWVEIAQNHYRKEPIRRVTLNYEEAAKANRIYTNYSVTERSWSKGAVTRFPNIGNIQRVTLPSKKINEDLKGSASTTRKFSTSTQSYKDDKIKGKGTEKPKGRLNVPVRYFNTSTESFNTRIPFPEKRKETFLDNKFQEIEISNDRKHKIVNPKIGIDQSVSDTGKIKGQVVRVPNLDSKTYIKENDKEDSGKLEEAHTKHTSKTLIKLESIPQTTKQPSMMQDNDNNYNDTITKLKFNEINDGANVDTQTKVENTSKGVKQTDSKYLNKDKIENNEKDGFQSEEDHLNNNSETNTVKVIWKLMKVVTDNISKNTRRSFKSKLRYLERLRNNILSNIEARIQQAWPDDDKAHASSTRSRRAARGHVEIPSSEGALMTISFLTFAVFLIKLVLQVIHTYKNKTMMVTPTLVAAVGRAAAEYRKHAHKQN